MVYCAEINESIEKAAKIIAISTASVTYERDGTFSFAKPYILDHYNNKTISHTSVSCTDTIKILEILDKHKSVLVVTMAKGTLDKGNDSKELVKSIVDQFVKLGYKRVVVFEGRSFGIPINYDTDNK